MAYALEYPKSQIQPDYDAGFSFETPTGRYSGPVRSDASTDAQAQHPHITLRTTWNILMAYALGLLKKVSHDVL